MRSRSLLCASVILLTFIQLGVAEDAVASLGT